MPVNMFARHHQSLQAQQRQVPDTRGAAREIRQQFGIHAHFPHLFYQPRDPDAQDQTPLTPEDRYKWHLHWLRRTWAFIDESAGQREEWYQTLSLAVPAGMETTAESDKDITKTRRGAPGKAAGILAGRSLLQSAMVTPSTLLGGYVGGSLGSVAGPVGVLAGGVAGATVAGVNAKIIGRFSPFLMSAIGH